MNFLHARVAGTAQVIFMISSLLLLLSSCAAQPAPETVKGVLTAYFEARKFRVKGMELGGIRPMELGQKTYMGTEGYHVEIRSITLEAADDIGTPWNYRKGELLTFKDAAVTVRELRGTKRQWAVSNISGILVP